MNNLDRLKLANKRNNETRDALLGFVAFYLPERYRKRFVGEQGREVFEHSVVYGNSVWSGHETYRVVVSQAQNFLVAIPRYRALLDAEYHATMEWSWAHDLVERDAEEYARSIDDTYQMIEREMWADVKEEC